MIWIDGRLLDAAPQCIPPAAVDGVFTTVGCDDGRPLLWDRHRERLLGIPWPGGAVDPGLLPGRSDLEGLLAAERCFGPARLRITLWRGGPSQPAHIEATCAPLEQCGTEIGPLELANVRWENPPPPGRKVIARRPWEDARDQARSWCADDALMIDGNGRLLETSRANVFVRRGLVVSTPPAPLRCLPGVMRGVLIDRLPDLGLRIEERDLHIDELAFADEVWVTNSVVGAVPVRRIGERTWTEWDFFGSLVRLGLPAPGWPS